MDLAVDWLLYGSIALRAFSFLYGFLRGSRRL